jgi:hypothetical protein
MKTLLGLLALVLAACHATPTARPRLAVASGLETVTLLAKGLE